MSGFESSKFFMARGNAPLFFVREYLQNPACMLISDKSIFMERIGNLKILIPKGGG